jgi:hypothetical protein
MAIEAGQIILAGSFTRASATRPGDQFVADYGPLGTVTCSFGRPSTVALVPRASAARRLCNRQLDSRP